MSSAGWYGRVTRIGKLAEVLTLYGICGEMRPFSRCLRCNDGWLEPVNKASILHLLEPLTIKYYDRFTRCNRCGRIYWAGSHREKMAALLARVKGETVSSG